MSADHRRNCAHPPVQRAKRRFDPSIPHHFPSDAVLSPTTSHMRQAHTTPRRQKDAPRAGPTIPSRPLPPENPAERPEGLHLSSPLRHDSGLSNPLRRYLSRQRGSLLPFSATRRFKYRAYFPTITHSRRHLHAFRVLSPSPHTYQYHPRAPTPLQTRPDTILQPPLHLPQQQKPPNLTKPTPKTTPNHQQYQQNPLHIPPHRLR